MKSKSKTACGRWIGALPLKESHYHLHDGIVNFDPVRLQNDVRRRKRSIDTKQWTIRIQRFNELIQIPLGQSINLNWFRVHTHPHASHAAKCKKVKRHKIKEAQSRNGNTRTVPPKMRYSRPNAKEMGK